MSKSYNDTITTMKVMTLFLVVFSHCTKMYSGTGVIEMPIIGSQQFLTSYIYAFHMPVFMFTSGAVYKKCIKAGKYQQLIPYCLTKVKRLIVPYLLIGLFCVSPTCVLLHLTDKSVLEHYFYGILLAQDKKHLWYLITLFLYLIAIRLVKPLLDRSELFALLALVLAIPMSVLSRGFGPIFYVAFFMMGYLFEVYAFPEKLMQKTWFLAPLFLLLICCDLPVIAPAAGIIATYQIAYKFGHLISDRKWYAHVAKNSMGIYLLDPMMIYIMYYVIRDREIDPWLATIVIFILAFVLSDLLTEIVRKIGLKAVIGEA